MKPRNSTLLITCVAVAFLGFSCARAPLKRIEEGMRMISEEEKLQLILEDDLALEPLIEAIENQIKFLNSDKNRFSDFQFGRKVLNKSEYIRGLSRFVSLYRKSKGREQFLLLIKEEFDFHEVYGNEDWGEVFITSYYEPVIRGSRRKTKQHSQPLYRMPNDLVEVDLEAFGVSPKEDESFPKGRLMKERTERGNYRVVPYFTREDIDTGDALKRRRLEICWVDPIDAYFLQIQGSGTVLFKDGSRIRVGYKEQNGHVYEAVGKYLTDVIPLEKMTLQSIETYLRKLSKSELHGYLNKNQSYVFFRKLKTKPITYLGTPVVSGRTIATDSRFFPKGAIAFLKFEKPTFETEDSTEALNWIPTSRFVIDQDKGGAIRGGGRVDLFWGSGKLARQHAGVMKGKGRLYYLVPR